VSQSSLLLCVCMCVSVCVCARVLLLAIQHAMKLILAACCCLQHAEVCKNNACHYITLQFAKNVPKPELSSKPQASPQQQQHKPGAARKAAANQGPKSGSGSKANGQQPSPQQQQVHRQEDQYAPTPPPLTELEILEAQHEADLKRVEEIRAQLTRACK